MSKNPKTNLLLSFRQRLVSFQQRLLLLLLIATILAAVWVSKPVLWPGGFGFEKGESVSTKSIERDAKGNVTKSVETTKIDEGKTLWDWLSLLGVPLSLAILGYWLQQMQQKRSEEVARAQRERDADETKEEVLQVYFDRLSVLLVDKNLLAIATKTKPAVEEKELLDSACDVIRARTLSILRRFEDDKERKTSVIRFLIEADIVGKLKLDVSGADLSYANLFGATLSRANLSFANLGDANLSRADLIDANLSDANLSRADLIDANLSDANLSFANLSFANLFGADLIGADLIGADLIGANLFGADLIGANLSGADLSSANLSSANLSSANLSGADLSGAKLIDVSNITVEDIQSTCFWQDAKFSDDFRAELDKAPEPKDKPDCSMWESK